jgi:hypothetical protein
MIGLYNLAAIAIETKLSSMKNSMIIIATLLFIACNKKAK